MLLLVFYFLFLPPADNVDSPCNNRISIARITKASSSDGGIEISVRASGKYICTLNVEKGTGPREISRKTGSGSSVVKFNNVNPDLIYMINVEFPDEEKSRCRRLQLSQIIIE